MRITVSHNRSKEQVIRTIDRSFDDLFQGVGLPVGLTQQRNSWQGSTLTFPLTAKNGPAKRPRQGRREVTDRDLTIDTIDADLGILERLDPRQEGPGNSNQPDPWPSEVMAMVTGRPCLAIRYTRT